MAHKESHLRTEASDYANNRVEETTSLRPTNEKLLEGIRALGVPPQGPHEMHAQGQTQVRTLLK